MRKEIEFTATVGRDKGRSFHIVEMSAADTEKWALQLIFAMMNAGVEIPDNVSSMGLAGLLRIGIPAIGKIPFGVAEPLLDRLMGCIKCVISPTAMRPLVESDIDEPLTLLQLKKAVFELHADSLKTAAP